MACNKKSFKASKADDELQQTGANQAQTSNESHKTTSSDSVLSAISSNLVQRTPSNCRVRSLSSSTSFQSAPPALSFKEIQRLNAIKMEFFGFGGWLASTLLYVLFLAWAFVPDATLESYGMSYYPSKHWALAIPAMIVMSYLFSIVVYKALNLMATPPLASYATVVGTSTMKSTRTTLNHGFLDVHSVFLDPQELALHSDAATPPISDIPITDVNQHLFGN